MPRLAFLQKSWPSHSRLSKRKSAPQGYPAIGPVMLAGSDARAVAFEQEIKPIVLNIVRLNLASGQVFRNPGSYTLNPIY